MSFALPFMIAQGLSSVAGGLTDQSGYKKVSNYDPAQKRIYQQLEQMLQGTPGSQKAMGLLEGYLDPNSDQYRDFEAPYMRQFNEQILPGIAERFSGAGANSGALSSSGFGQALGGAAAGLQSNLAGMKEQIRRQSIGDILQQYQNQIQNRQGYLGLKPFGYQDQGPGMLSNLFTKFGGMSNPFGSPQFGSGGGNKFPLTGGYDTQFRQGGVY